jgi:hypothetical protein
VPPRVRFPARPVLLAALGAALAAACGRAAPDTAREEQVQSSDMAADSGLAAAPPPPPAVVAAAPMRGAPVLSGAEPRARSIAGAAAGAPAASKAPAGAPGGGGPGVAAQDTAVAPMLIRTGTAAVEVDSLEPALARVRALAAQLGGYVANSSLAAGREQVRSATLELRVPAARFDALVGGLAPVGRVERVDVQAQDVGEEFVDVTARVANARRLEARLVELLARRTGKLEDVLSVERELARVREEVERHDGRLRYLRTRAATSTLAVSVHERAPLIAERPGAAPVADAFRAAGRNFVALLAAVIASSGVWLPVGLVAYGVWRWRRRQGAASARPPATPPPAAPPPAPSAA